MNIFATEQGILGDTDYARQHNTFHAFLTLARSIRKRLGARAYKLDEYIEHYRIQIAPRVITGRWSASTARMSCGATSICGCAVLRMGKAAGCVSASIQRPYHDLSGHEIPQSGA